MPCTAEISRARRSCILFLIDQSASMEDAFGGEASRRKMQGVADAINRLLHTLILRCTTANGVKHAYDLGVIGYGKEIRCGFGGSLAGRELVPVNAVADALARIEERTVKVEDGAAGLVAQVKKIPMGFEPVADGPTPMAGALEQAHRILSGWLPDHTNAFPPLVIHITDGDATDGDPLCPRPRPSSSWPRRMGTCSCSIATSLTAPPSQSSSPPPRMGCRMRSPSSGFACRASFLGANGHDVDYLAGDAPVEKFLLEIVCQMRLISSVFAREASSPSAKLFYVEDPYRLDVG